MVTIIHLSEAPWVGTQHFTSQEQLPLALYYMHEFEGKGEGEGGRGGLGGGEGGTEIVL